MEPQGRSETFKTLVVKVQTFIHLTQEQLLTSYCTQSIVFVTSRGYERRCTSWSEERIITVFWDQCLAGTCVTPECLELDISSCHTLKNLPVSGKVDEWTAAQNLIGFCEYEPERCLHLCWAMVGDALPLKTKCRETVLRACVLLHDSCLDEAKPSNAFAFTKWQPYQCLYIQSKVFALGHLNVQLFWSILQNIFWAQRKRELYLMDYDERHSFLFFCYPGQYSCEMSVKLKLIFNSN